MIQQPPTPGPAAEGSVAEGEMARRVREFDWARTSLGPREQWPVALRTAVDICLRSRHPVDVLLGPDLIQVYNDAYRPMLGARHPRALGQPLRECWNEVWHVVGPLAEAVVASGRACWFEDFPLLVHRNGYDEETYFTFSYSRLDAGDGSSGGVFVEVLETTGEVIGRRRHALLYELATRTADVRSAEQACDVVAAVLDEARADVPFAALYLADAPGDVPSLHLRVRCAEGLPDRIPPDATAASPLAGAVAEALRHRKTVVLHGEPAALEAARRPAMVLPVQLPAQGWAAGVLVLGLSPRLALDTAYAQFLEMICGHVGAAFARAHGHTAEQRRIVAEATLELRRRAEADLRRQALVFESVSEAVVITDAEGGILDCNPAAERLSGYRRADLVGANLEVLRPADLRDGYDRAALAAAARDGVWVGDVRFLRPDGEERVAETTVVPQHGADGSVAFVRVARDVTERKQAERWAEAQRSVLETMASGRPLGETLGALASLLERQLPGAVCSIRVREDGSLQCTAAPSLPEAFVRAVDELLVGRASGAGDAAHQAKPVVVLDAMTNVPGTDCRELLLAHGLRSVWSTPIVAPDGATLGTIALYHRVPHAPKEHECRLMSDATRLAAVAVVRHRTEKVLRRQALAFELLSDAVVLTDAEGCVTGWNPAAAALTGYAAAQVIGQSIPSHLVGLTDADRISIRETMERDGAWSGELQFVRQDGVSRLAEATTVGEYDGSRRLVGSISVARDITERRRADEALRRWNEQLTALVRMQQDVAMAGLDVGAVMRRIADGVQELTRAEGALVGVPEGDDVVVAAATGMYASRAGVRVPRSLSVAAATLRSGVLTRIDDTHADPRVDARMHEFYGRSLIAVPLIHNQERIGVLAVGASRPAAFGDHDEQALTLTAGLLAAAVAHAFAFEAKRRLVAERTAALDALARREEWLRALSASSPVGIFAADEHGACLFVNPRCADIYGVPTEAMAGDGWLARVHPDDRDAVRREWIVAQRERRSSEREFRIVHPTAGSRWVRSHAAPVTGERGPAGGYVGTVEDITDRKEADEALRRAERQYRELLDSVDAVVWRAAGSPPRLTFVSQQAEAVLGRAADSLVGRELPLVDLVHPNDVVAATDNVTRVQRWTTATQFEFRIRTPAGETRWLRTLLRHVRERPEPGEIIGVTFDVTEFHRARHELAHSQRQLREFASELQTIRERERTHIAREIHDELGQALTGLKMELAWLRTKLPKRSRTLAASAEHMVAQVDRTIETVRRIASELRPSVLDSLGLVAALEWQVREFERNTRIRATLSVHDEGAEPDAERSTAIFRIVQEALTNVARHANASSVDVTVRRDGDDLLVVVHDDGCGVSAEAARGAESLGILGMRERALASVGTVTIAPAPGRGTVVAVRMPLGTPVSSGAAAVGEAP